MLKLLPALFFALVLGACAKKSTTSGSSAASVIGSCTATSNGHSACLALDANISQADRANACAGSVTSADTSCAVSYGGVMSKGTCTFTYQGYTNVYRFYENNATTEQTMCQFVDDQGGTATWLAD